SNKNVAYAGGYVKNASNQDASALFKTTDGGTGWNEMAVPSPVSGADRINAVVIDPFDVNRILFGTNQHIYVSTNGGTDWQYSPKWAYVTYLIADGNTAGRIYAGTSGLGVLTTTDGGTNWNEMNAGLTNKYIQCMDLDPAGSTLYIGTNGGGVYRYSIETGVRGRDVPQPVEFILHQNYPNPFNPATTIRYELKKREEVLLSIVDMHGRAVRILLDGIQSAGANQAVWDGKDASGRDMPSGIYFCRLAAGGHQSVRKMILCK
ncbi:MAG TPA: T9SS type A sorting domain-containing protein, partial [bacterium]